MCLKRGARGGRGGERRFPDIVFAWAGTTPTVETVAAVRLPQLRKQGNGLVVWVSSSSTCGGTLPYLGPYFAAKAARNAAISRGV
jgi:hypothetical protein